MKMIEVKTADLIGPALDWAVAQAAFGKEPYQIPCEELGTWWAGESSGGYKDWSPSTDWTQCGPLIEKYKLTIWHKEEDHDETPWCADHPKFGGNVMFRAESYLIAACRVIVAAKLGDEVQVPAELVQP